MSDYLYFDHAAATSIRPEAWAAIASLRSLPLANPSSTHQYGRQSKALIDEARIKFAELCMVKSDEVIFTSGATEAVHTGLIGAYLGLKTKRPARRGRGVVYTSPLVHSCVWAALDFLKQNHQVEIKKLPILSTGHLDLETIDEALIGESDMIVIEHLNSEIGVLQPASKLGKKIIRYAEETGNSKPIFMVDAAASAVSELVGLDFQKCDLLSLSAEKIGGLSGTGVLLRRQKLVLKPLLGGSQEWGRRGGTENTLGITAFHRAYTAYHQHLEPQNTQLDLINERLRSFFETELKEYKITTPREGSGRHILHVVAPIEPASLIVAQADLKGVAISAGSACSSGSVENSKVLSALGYDEETSQRGFRISWGWSTTMAETEWLITRLKELL